MELSINQKKKMGDTMNKIKYVERTYELTFEEACIFLQTNEIVDGIRTYEQNIGV